MYGGYGPRVGNVQSVFRAELGAVVQAIRYFAKRRRGIILEGGAPPTHVHIVSDCMSVVVAHGKGPRGIHQGASLCDLWHDLFQANSGVTVSMEWCKAHTTMADVEAGIIPPLNRVGN